MQTLKLFIFQLILFINAPICYAIFFALISKKNTPKKYNILVLSKPVFNNDIESIAKISNELSFTFFPRLLLSKICSKYISNFDELNDFNYHENVNKEDKNILKLRKKMFLIFYYYTKLIKVDAVVSGNFVYTQIQELLISLKDLKIPSIVIYKEGMLPIIKFKDVKSFLYKSKVFRADLILFYNDLIKDAVLKADIKGINPRKTKVIGIPRFDEYFNHNSKPNKIKITLFSFEPTEKSNYLVDDKSKLKLFHESVVKFHKLFAEFILKNPHFELVVKTKPSKKSIKFAKKVFASYDNILGNRLSLSSEINSESLIKESKYIVGFSSTTLIEGLLLDRIIICPKFDYSIISPKNDLIYPYDSLVNRVDNLTELSSLIHNGGTKSSKFIRDKNKFIKERIYKFDGKSSKRSEKYIIEKIKEYKN